MAKTQSYEFFGPHGPILLIAILPLVVYGLFFGCNGETCLSIFPKFSAPDIFLKHPFYSNAGMLAMVGWFTLVLGLHLVLPGKRMQGVDIPGRGKLTYKLNAFWVLLVIYGSVLYFSFVLHILDLTWVYDNFLNLLTASTIVSCALSLYLYLSSLRKGLTLSQGGVTGYVLYDFWMGRELNPRIGSLDLKEFCELYPGLIGWVILNLSMAYTQQQRLGYVTNSMWLVNTFELFYVVDALWNEQSILTTMDITTDGFGFMLAFGDLTWVPFVFCTQARYLVDYPQDLSWPVVGAILGVHMLGYWIFRGANGQKDLFRRNPNDPKVRHLKTLPTERGTRLIISGWWGLARHINYLGDWIMGLSWCLPCGMQGLSAVVPYFYVIYFASLLIHRELRDEHACRVKYGKDWDKYCSLVKYRIVPLLY